MFEAEIKRAFGIDMQNLKIKMFHVNMPVEIGAAVTQTLHSGYITEGPKVKEFENRLSGYLREPFVLAVNSGTSALQLGLLAAGVKPGDTVLTTPMTCTATNLAILAVGANPYWIDIDPRTGNIDINALYLAQNHPRATAAMVVDWGGRLVNVPLGLQIPVVEDAAHAFIPRTHVWGRDRCIRCFSFQAIKHITTGDGGAVTLASSKQYERIKRLRWFGLDRDWKSEDGDNRVGQDITEPGYKFHMNDIAATIGLENLKDLTRIMTRHQWIAREYSEHLDKRVFYTSPIYETNAYWLFTVLLPDGNSRRRFMRYMKIAGIETSQVHGRCDTLTAFRNFQGPKGLPGVIEFMDRQVSIPIHAGLMDTDVRRIISEANKWAKIEG